MYDNLKRSFIEYIREWREVAVRYLPEDAYAENDFIFTVTYAQFVTVYDGTDDTGTDKPYWLLQHVGKLSDHVITMYFNTERELYIWGCNFLVERIRLLRERSGV